MTSPPCEDVSFSSFKKRTKCFLHRLRRCRCPTRRTTQQNKGVELAFSLLAGAFQAGNKNIIFLTAQLSWHIVYIYDQTVRDSAWGRFEWISFLWDVGTVKVNTRLTVTLVVKSQSNSLYNSDDKYMPITQLVTFASVCCSTFSVK